MQCKTSQYLNSYIFLILQGGSHVPQSTKLTLQSKAVQNTFAYISEGNSLLNCLA